MAYGSVNLDPSYAYDLAASKARTATLVVAASNSSTKAKAAADYVCDGTGDRNVINNAIAALPYDGGKIVLLEGAYNISSMLEIVRDVVFEGMGEGTVLNVSDDLATYAGERHVMFRDMKINANGINQYLYSADPGELIIEEHSSVMLDNVTLNMTAVGAEADGKSAFPKAFKAVNSRIKLGAGGDFVRGSNRCYAITDGGVFTNCDITLDGSVGRIHTGRSNTTMNGCDVHIINSKGPNNQGIVGGLCNTMTGGTLEIDNSNPAYAAVECILAGSYSGVYITLTRSDSCDTDIALTTVIGCHLHNLTLTGDKFIANTKV